MTQREPEFPYTDVTILMHSPFSFGARLRPHGLRAGQEASEDTQDKPLERQVFEAILTALKSKPYPDVHWSINELRDSLTTGPLLAIAPEFSLKASPLRADITEYLKRITDPDINILSS